MPMMKREDRAKQFAPFESLAGLRAALAAKEAELERVEKRELSESRAAHIDRTLKKLERGMRVIVTYYSGGYYVDVTGYVTKIDAAYGCMAVGEGKIPFDDLYDIRILDS